MYQYIHHWIYIFTLTTSITTHWGLRSKKILESFDAIFSKAENCRFLDNSSFYILIDSSLMCITITCNQWWAQSSLKGIFLSGTLHLKTSLLTCISTCKCMLAHAFILSKKWKMLENDQKSTFFSVFHCFRLCERMRKHAFPGRNTQQPVQLWPKLVLKLFY